jgi:predicted phosphodiesterase
MRLRFKILSVFLAISIFSCNIFDLGGLFVSSYVNDRFVDSTGYFPVAPPAVDDTSDYAFMVIADPHYYTWQPGYLAHIEEKKSEWDVEFIVILGDIVQAGQPHQFKYFTDDLVATTLPVYVIPGNHDLYNNGYNQWKDIAGPTVFAFSIGDDRLLFLDTANGTLGSRQTNWLEEELKENQHQKTMLFTHYGFFDETLQSATVWSSSEEKYRLIDLFSRMNVDVVLSGHLHFFRDMSVRGVRYIHCDNMDESTADNYLRMRVTSGTITADFVK